MRPEPATDPLVAMYAAVVATRIVYEVLEARARTGGPVGRAALAELDRRDPIAAQRIRTEIDLRLWVRHIRLQTDPQFFVAVTGSTIA